jgi:serine/threonine-protein kinase RsbW
MSGNAADPGAGPPGLAATHRLLILNRAEEMVLFLELLATALDRLGYPAREATGVRLAVEEAILNGLYHGNRGDPSKCVWVRFRFEAAEILVEVEDEGPGFDPERVPDPTLAENRSRSSGRGLLLMRHYMTSVHYSGRGNCVTLRKRRVP